MIRLTSIFRNECNACGIALVPSRFIICCVNGHVDDFPYFNWVHSGSPRMDGEHRMTIESAGDTASLADIVISCTCRKRATMEDAFYKNGDEGRHRDARDGGPGFPETTPHATRRPGPCSAARRTCGSPSRTRPSRSRHGPRVPSWC